MPRGDIITVIDLFQTLGFPERIPLSPERQKSMIERQIQDITFAIAEAKAEDDGKSFTVKQMEKTKKTLQAKLQKLNDQSRRG